MPNQPIISPATSAAAPLAAPSQSNAPAGMNPILDAYCKDSTIPQENKSNLASDLDSGATDPQTVTPVLMQKYPQLAAGVAGGAVVGALNPANVGQNLQNLVQGAGKVIQGIGASTSPSTPDQAQQTDQANVVANQQNTQAMQDADNNLRWWGVTPSGSTSLEDKQQQLGILQASNPQSALAQNIVKNFLGAGQKIYQAGGSDELGGAISGVDSQGNQLDPTQRATDAGKAAVDIGSGGLGMFPQSAMIGGAIKTVNIPQVNDALNHVAHMTDGAATTSANAANQALGIDPNSDQGQTLNGLTKNLYQLLTLKIIGDTQTELARQSAMSSALNEAQSVQETDPELAQKYLDAHDALSTQKPTLTGSLGASAIQGASAALQPYVGLIQSGLSNTGEALQNSGEAAFQSSLPPNAREAGLIQAQDVGRAGDIRTTAQSAFENDVVSQNPLADLSKRWIGDNAMRTADGLFKNVIQPELTNSDVKLNFQDGIDQVQSQIDAEPEPGRQAALQKGLDALKADYSGEDGNLDPKYQNQSLADAQDIKSGLDNFTPQKMFKGEDVASGYTQIKNDFADWIRGQIHDNISPEASKAYYDYGNLIDLSKISPAAMQQAGTQGGWGKAFGNIVRTLGMPVAVAGGKILYNIGGFLKQVSAGPDGEMIVTPPSPDQLTNHTPLNTPPGPGDMSGPGAESVSDSLPKDTQSLEDPNALNRAPLGFLSGSALDNARAGKLDDMTYDPENNYQVSHGKNIDFVAEPTSESPSGSLPKELQPFEDAVSKADTYDEFQKIVSTTMPYETKMHEGSTPMQQFRGLAVSYGNEDPEAFFNYLKNGPMSSGEVATRKTLK